ncbi:type I-E CRISPR-associated protein Cse1/CasA [Endozoicomonas sp. SESOKO1]|uniref:type I-E CRISPR-associated protein Cse1/CasA n=1 Tax=Endozoicomonas sp. SESOKO1 TaxID=2828742 RepID=UPI002148B3F7|nr:type I-E CRISPR-associated protein Cse1/CasA [Endozoicomonas sp. SESOKO1]
MNLINDPWIPVVREDGSKDIIAPWQIAEADNPVIEIAAPRPDFQGALYQFLIGLLQTSFAPEDEDEWLERWEGVPDSDSVKIAFARFSEAFELINAGGPKFLQDSNLQEQVLLKKGEPVSRLLIGAPGKNTEESNKDLFIKRQHDAVFCQSCAATALFTLQTNGPQGGSGHMTGIRGGGPLTTILLPVAESSALWQKLWVNVLFKEGKGWDKVDSCSEKIFPWLDFPALSKKKLSPTFPESVSPLHGYWGMPRRILLQVATNTDSSCALCGNKNGEKISHFITDTYGINYEGPWLHPLTPYRFDRKQQSLPLSIKGKEGGLGYQHWLGLNFQDKGNGCRAAEVIAHFQIRACDFPELSKTGFRLWCFGYDMDGFKALCWYEHQLPVIKMQEPYREVFIDLVTDLIESAKEVVRLLRKQIKAAWDIKDEKKLKVIDASFWEATEPPFYELLQILALQPESTSSMPPAVARQWVDKLRNTAANLFDYWVLEGEPENMDMKRIIRARRSLDDGLYKSKALKRIVTIADMATAPDYQEEVG